jgi:hemerythrin
MGYNFMTKLVWLDEYRIGDDTIDQQHKYLFDLANQIVDPFNDAQKIHHNLKMLYHYVIEHFKVEESFMRQCNYPDYKKHIKEHDEIARKLSEISMSVITGETSSSDVAEVIHRWQSEHFLEKDLSLADLLQHKNKHKLSAVC